MMWSMGLPAHSGSVLNGSATTWSVAVKRPCCSCQSPAFSARASHASMCSRVTPGGSDPT
eukprot:11020466-Alexandrium_andersonii.AAC.1